MNTFKNRIGAWCLLTSFILLAACSGGSGDVDGNELALDGSTLGESATDLSLIHI